MSNDELVEALVRQGYTLEEAQRIVAEREPVQSMVLAKLTSRQIRLLASADEQTGDEAEPEDDVEGEDFEFEDEAAGEDEALDDDGGEELADDMDIDVYDDSGFMGDSDVTEAELETAIKVIDAIADNILDAAGVEDFGSDADYSDVLDMVGEIVDVADESGLGVDEPDDFGFDEGGDEDFGFDEGGDEGGEDFDFGDFEEEEEGGDEEVTARFIRKHLLSRRSPLIRRLGRIVSRRGFRAVKSRQVLEKAFSSVLPSSRHSSKPVSRRGAKVNSRRGRYGKRYLRSNDDALPVDKDIDIGTTMDEGHEENLLGDDNDSIPVNPLGEMVWDGPQLEEEVLLPTEDKGDEPVVFQRVSRNVYVIKRRGIASRYAKKVSNRVKPLKNGYGMYFYPSRTLGLIGIKAPLIKGLKNAVYSPFVKTKGGYVNSSGQMIVKSGKASATVVIAPVTNNKNVKRTRNAFDFVDYVTSSYHRAKMREALAQSARARRVMSRSRNAGTRVASKARREADFYKGVARRAMSDLQRANERIRSANASRARLERRSEESDRRQRRVVSSLRREADRNRRAASSLARSNERANRALEDQKAKAAIDIAFNGEKQVVTSSADKSSAFARNVDYLSRMM